MHRKLWQINLLKKIVERGYAVAVESHSNWILELTDRRPAPAGSSGSVDPTP